MNSGIGEMFTPDPQNRRKYRGSHLKRHPKRRDAAAECLVRIQQEFYDAGTSFVICELTPEVEKTLENNGLLELMNVTPPKARLMISCDEEVERELLKGPAFRNQQVR